MKPIQYQKRDVSHTYRHPFLACRIARGREQEKEAMVVVMVNLTVCWLEDTVDETRVPLTNPCRVLAAAAGIVHSDFVGIFASILSLLPM